MRSPPSNSFKTQWWGHRCCWRKKPQKVRRCRRRCHCRCHRPIESIKKVCRLGVRNPRKKTQSLFLCSYGFVVQNPVTDSVLEPDIDQRWADQEADLRGFDQGGRGVLMPWKQWEKFGACMWVLWTWISGWVRWWFWLGLWFGFHLCLISICDLDLCLCLVSVSFLFFFRLCCCDLGLSFWLLGLIWEEHKEQVITFLWKIIMIINNVLLLGFYSFAWVWFGGGNSVVIF